MDYDVELNTRGLRCPLPILKTRLAMDGMESGQVIKVISTDAGSVRDMEAFARQTEHDLLDSLEAEGEYVFYLRCR